MHNTPTMVQAIIQFKDDGSQQSMTFCVQDYETVKDQVNDDEIFYYGDDPRKFVGQWMNQDFKVISIL